MLEIHQNYVINSDQQPIAVQLSLAEFEKITLALNNLQTDSNVPSNIDIEKNIIVQITPISHKQVKLRVQHLGRAKPQVTYNPLPLD